MHRSQLGCLLPCPVAIGLKAPRRRHTHIYTHIWIYIYVCFYRGTNRQGHVCGGGGRQVDKLQLACRNRFPVARICGESVYIYIRIPLRCMQRKHCSEQASLQIKRGSTSKNLDALKLVRVGPPAGTDCKTWPAVHALADRNTLAQMDPKLLAPLKTSHPMMNDGAGDAKALAA